MEILVRNGPVVAAAGFRGGRQVILDSSNFVFPPAPSAGCLTGLELASRLSFFLWSSVPDSELLDVGITGGLATQDGKVTDILTRIDLIHYWDSNRTR